MVEARLVVTALALMLAMFLAGVHGLRHRIGIAILALLSLSWFTVDKLFEGNIVFELTKTHAITTSDFVGLLGLIVSGLLWWHSRPARAPRPVRPAAPVPGAAPDRPAPTREHSSTG